MKRSPRGLMFCLCVSLTYLFLTISARSITSTGGSVAECLACWTQAQKAQIQIAVAVLGKLFTPIVPLFTKPQNW